LIRIVVAPRARRDVMEIGLWSEARFGRGARLRYLALIQRAFLDLRKRPDRGGVQARSSLPDDLRLYHIRHSRSGARALARVGTPRHFIVFRLGDDSIEIVRVLHDGMDLEQHL